MSALSQKQTYTALQVCTLFDHLVSAGEQGRLITIHFEVRTRLSRHRVPRGAIAQLGERLNGIQEVRGSTPLGSTNSLIAEITWIDRLAVNVVVGLVR